MYDDLLRIKVFREQDAANAVTRQRYIVDKCAQEVEQARAKAVEFGAYRVEKEQQLFDDIKGQAVTMRVIDDMKLRVAALREQEAEFQSEILVAEKQLKGAQQVLEEVHQQHAKRVREHEKFNQFIQIRHEAERLERVRCEENELDEVASIGHRANSMAQ